MYEIKSMAEIRSSTENNKHIFDVVSLFAGGGGSSLGYRMAGGKVLAINEFIDEARKTYSANWPSTIIFGGDIRSIDPSEILRSIGKKSGELDLLDGSPPCSPFSIAGAKEKNWGKFKKYSDAKQGDIEDLFFEYIRILRVVMPKAFVAENVAGLVRGKAKGYFNKILRELRSSGYHVEAKILDAKWLGVPQSRQRLIFIGIRNDLFADGMTGKLHPKPMKKIVTLRESFVGLKFSNADKLETDIRKYATWGELVKLPRGGQSKKYFQLTKGNPDSVSQCITATMSNLSSAACRHWDNRAYTVNEVKRIMSVPDDYILTGSYQQRVERLGRMVPPLMIKQVAESIIKTGVFENGNTR